MRPVLLSATLLLTLSIAVPLTRAATLIHSYNLNGNFTDQFGGPSLVADGGSVGADLYTFGADQGLQLSSALPDAGNYSIELNFEFDTTASGFDKIIDFADRASDNGLYNFKDTLYFYSAQDSVASVFSPSTFAHVVLTRDSSTNQVVGYVDGVQQISFTDSNIAVFTAANNLIRFFEDDTHTGGAESSAGSVDFIRIYDGALSPTDVTGLSDTDRPDASPVPLPASATAGLILLASLAAARRTKSQLV